MADRKNRPATSKARRGAALSPEERALWDSVTRDAKPLKKAPRRADPRLAPETHPETQSGSQAETPPGKPKTAAPRRTATAIAPVPKPKPPPVLGHGDIADLDKRSAERMRRGKLPIEGRLDLHGHSQDQARRELAAFLARAQAAGKRCVIVITGRGDITQGGGVLRAQVPSWLNEPENRARVLAFDYAQPRHGGLGALYVLLRKGADLKSADRRPGTR